MGHPVRKTRRFVGVITRLNLPSRLDVGSLCNTAIKLISNRGPEMKSERRANSSLNYIFCILIVVAVGV